MQRFVADEWDCRNRAQHLSPFFPPDAQSIGDVVSSDGTHHLYNSLLLANTFPPGAFLGSYGSPAPGTFDVLCNTEFVSGSDAPTVAPHHR